MFLLHFWNDCVCVCVCVCVGVPVDVWCFCDIHQHIWATAARLSNKTRWRTLCHNALMSKPTNSYLYTQILHPVHVINTMAVARSHIRQTWNSCHFHSKMKQQHSGQHKNVWAHQLQFCCPVLNVILVKSLTCWYWFLLILIVPHYNLVTAREALQKTRK